MGQPLPTRPQLFPLISEKCLLGEVIIAFLHDFMLRQSDAKSQPTYSERACSLGGNKTKTI